MARILDFADGFESSTQPEESLIAASGVSNTPSGNLVATNVQSALNELQSDIDAINTSKGANSGIATLDSGGKVPSSQLPAIAITEVYVVADIAARDALTVDEGDIAKVTDAGGGTTKTYIYDGSSWVEIQADGQLVAHITDTSGAHAASAISNTPSGNLSSSDVQAALNELQSDVDTRATSTSLSDHISDSSAAHAASAVSNTPTGNLSSTDVQAALNELQAEIDSLSIGGGNPAGAIIAFGGSSSPAGYLTCDGSAVSRATYSTLFSAIGAIHGIGDGSTTFNLPDLRGKFLRGFSDQATNDPNRASRTAAVASTHSVTGGATTNGSPNITVGTTVNLAPGMTVTGTGIPASSVVRSITDATTFVLGNTANTANVNATATNTGLTFTVSKAPTANYPGAIQNDATKRPNTSFTTDSAGVHTHGIGTGFANANSVTNLSSVASRATTNTTDSAGAHAHTVTAGGDNETRPLNVYVIYCIKT